MLTVGTDSYVSLDEADAYFSARNAPDAWMAATAAQKEEALRYATRFIDSSFEFLGYLQDTDQALKWPRYSIYDDDGRVYEGTPVEVKEATFELGRSHLNDAPLNQPAISKAPPGIASVTAGPVSVEFSGRYASSSDISSPAADYAYVRRLLARFTSSGGNRVAMVRS